MLINTDALRSQNNAVLDAYAKRHGIPAVAVFVERQVRKNLIRELAARFDRLPMIDKELALSVLRSFEDF